MCPHASCPPCPRRAPRPPCPRCRPCWCRVRAAPASGDPGSPCCRTPPPAGCLRGNIRIICCCCCCCRCYYYTQVKEEQVSVFGDGGAARGTDRGGPDTVQAQGLVHLVTVDTGDCRYLGISRYLHNLGVPPWRAPASWRACIRGWAGPCPRHTPGGASQPRPWPSPPPTSVDIVDTLAR